jgi:AcrR family transcriptional regulator
VSRPPRSAQRPARRQAPEDGHRRAKWGTVCREDIVEAAIRAVSIGGYETMTIRSLAAGLGVSPMSLYRHIRDKDDLLGEVVDRLLAMAWRPSAPTDDWEAWLIEAAARFRQFLVTQPAALHIYLRQPVVSPAAIARMTATMDVLRQAGLDDEVARSAYGALHTYTIGFAALEASRARWTPAEAAEPGVSRQLAAYTSTDQFMAGLGFVLNGILPASARD